MDAKPKRRWFRYSLRTLLVLVAIACVGFGWLGIKVRAKDREREAVKAIRKAGGFVWYDYEWDSYRIPKAVPGQPPAPGWLRKLCGDDFFGSVYVVALGTEATDADLRHIAGMNQLKELYINVNNITDAAVVGLPDLPDLEELCLSDSKVTDKGLAHVQRFPKLKKLDLVNCCQVSNAGIAKLRKTMPHLKIDLTGWAPQVPP